MCAKRAGRTSAQATGAGAQRNVCASFATHPLTESQPMPILQLVTCYRVTVRPGTAAAWVGDFFEPPSLSDIQEAIKLNLGPRRSSNDTLLDVLDGIDPNHEQYFMRYKPQDEGGLMVDAWTPSKRTCLGEVRICKGAAVICRTRWHTHPQGGRCDLPDADRGDE